MTARYDAARSIVWTTGPIVRLDELPGFADGCESLYNTLSGIANLDCMEPNLGVTLTATTNGHIDAQVHITPDHIREKHEFNELIDQTFLPRIIEQCRQILIAHPLRKPETGRGT